MMPGAYSRDDLIDVVNEQRAEIIRLVQKNTDLIIERDGLKAKLAGFTEGMPSQEHLVWAVIPLEDYCGCGDHPEDVCPYMTVARYLRKLAAMQDERVE